MAGPTPVREDDHLLTRKNAAIALIDYQPGQFDAVTSSSREDIVLNAILLARTANAYGIPVVLTTAGVAVGANQGLIEELATELPDVEVIDRTTLNAWEDSEFHAAIEATGRSKLIMSGLWTEVCLTYPTLDALQDGYEVYPVADAAGGVSKDAHERGMERMIQAGAQPVTAFAVMCEIQRDWAHEGAESVREIGEWYLKERSEQESLETVGGQV